MRISIIQNLCCPDCQGKLAWHAYEMETNEEIKEGVAWCTLCYHFYPIEDNLLELLPPKLAYHEDKVRFWDKHEQDLRARGLIFAEKSEPDVSIEMQKQQQEHFDWYCHNKNQDYNSYERLAFWEGVDKLTFSNWRKCIQPGKSMLDIGCAQGRSAFKFMDMPIDIVGFDISKSAIRQAIERYKSGQYLAKATFFCADGANLPFYPQTFDYVLVYGVLHHLPDPAGTCRQIAKILKTHGIYFGSENNKTVFRSVFDLLMKMKPLWHEEAGAEPLISSKQLHDWFADTSMEIEIKTHVFLPPHFINLLKPQIGLQFLQLTDWLGGRIPFIRSNGGLIQCYGTKKIDARQNSSTVI